MAAKTTLERHEEAKRSGKLSSGINEEEILATTTDIEMRNIFKMFDKLPGVYDASLVQQL